MKKAIILLLLFGMSFTSLCGCQKTTAPNVWDGTIAEAFAGGNGSKETPYRMETASQLAFLAQEINIGKDYKGKFFALDRDLDLNNIPWTPIGNQEHNFEGTFDGKGHTISGLNITEAISYTQTRSASTPPYTVGVVGLFGCCSDSSFFDVTIQGANVSVNNIESYTDFYAGILVARLEAQDSTISNIKVYNSQFTTNHTASSADGAYPRSLVVGGIFGSIRVKESSQCIMNRVAGDIVVYDDLGKAETAIGGIAGLVYNRSDFTASDISSRVKVPLLTNIEKQNIGAFGNIGNLVDCHVKLSQAFSVVEIDYKTEDTNPLFDNANALIGSVNQIKDMTGSCKDASFDFDHLFGYVQLTDSATKQSEQRYSLYVMPEYIPTENIKEDDCQGSTKLPQDCRFDKGIWDLSNLSDPKLK